MIAKVVSGAQTGVDIAALRAARSLGIPTGGTMPRGWRTLDGPRPGYAALYGAVEHWSPKYTWRTLVNVEVADLTVLVAVDFGSPGSLCTMKAIEQTKRPWVDIILRADMTPNAYSMLDAEREVQRIAGRLRRPIVLNVAGNSERRAPGIEAAAEVLLRGLFLRCRAGAVETNKGATT